MQLLPPDRAKLAEATDLIRLQLELQGIKVTSDGLLMHVSGGDVRDVARCYILRDNGGRPFWLGRDLPPVLRERLQEFLYGPERNEVEARVGRAGEGLPCPEIRRWRTWLFTTCIPSDYRDAVRLEPAHRALAEEYDHQMSLTGQSVFAIIVDGQIAATCESAPENAHAAEAWVRTLPAFRRRGYARQVTAAWGHSLQQNGKVPFYTHRWENVAAHALAQSLGLILLFDILECE